MFSFTRRHGGHKDSANELRSSIARRAARAVALSPVAFCALSLVALCAPAAAAVAGQPPAADSSREQSQQQSITQAQAELYERWRANINRNQTLAHEAGRDYLGRYPEPGEYAAHVRRWVTAYERESRKLEFLRLFKSQKYPELFRVGEQVLAEEPEHLKTIIHLAYAGYLAAGQGDDSFGEAALAHARRAVLLVDSGRASDWQPFADQQDALGHLHFVIGELSIKSDPEEAARLFRRAVEIGGAVGRTPVLYSRLAAAYVADRYEPLSKDYESRYAGREPSDESRAALTKVNAVVDLVIDAYARAVAFAGDDPRYAEARRRWSDELTRFYKFRHNGTTDGLEAFITGITAKPLPQ